MQLKKWPITILLLIFFAQFFIAGNSLAKTNHAVQPGETLWHIAQKYGTSIAAIRQLNGIWHDILNIGQKILVPVGSAKAHPSSQEVDLLARIIYAEARGETYLGQVAVGAVILNRVQSNKFPNTISSVVYEPLAFEPVLTGQHHRHPDEDAYRAAREALAGHDPTGGALYFYNPAKVTNPQNWIWSRPILTRIGNHVFCW